MSKTAIRTLLSAWFILALTIPSVMAGETGAKDLFAPVFVNRPQGFQFYHCDTARYTFQAVSAATGLPSYWVRYQLISGPGTIDSLTGEWQMGPTFDPKLIGNYSLEIGASELGLHTTGLQNCRVPLQIYSYAPYINCVTPNFDGRIEIYGGKTGRLDFAYQAQYGCDTGRMFLAYVQPLLAGNVAFQDLAGRATLTVSPDTTDEGQYFQIRLGATNGIDTNYFSFQLHVLPDPTFEFHIGRVVNVLQGGFTTVPVTLVKQQASTGLGGFDFLLAYDNSALALQSVSNDSSALYRQCNWEYFTSRFGANGNCSEGCPSGLVRVVGLAETNNGNFHPLCGPTFLPSLPTEMFRMRFLVSNNRTLSCSWIPIRFFWVDCSDNSCARPDGQQRMLSSAVYNVDSAGKAILDSNPPAFPGYDGAPSGLCGATNPYELSPLTNLTFYNGGLDIICADSIDARGIGDINCNGVGFEVSDCVLFTNYFLQGEKVFGSHSGCSLSASDVNGDGVAATLADLVYLERVIVGDTVPYPKQPNGPVVDTCKLHFQSGTLAYPGNVQLGALLAVFQGAVTPTSFAADYAMMYDTSGGTTRVLILPPLNSFPSHAIASGPLVSVTPGSSPLSVEAATRSGAVLAVEIDSPTEVESKGSALPLRFSLHQNYPNPFNATTVIRFDLPKASAVSVDVINILGQMVWTSAGHYAAGSHKLEWNGTGTRGTTVSSGVYLYRLKAGEYVETKKMVLLK